MPFARAAGDGSTPLSAPIASSHLRALRTLGALWLLCLAAFGVSLIRATVHEGYAARHEAYVRDLHALAASDALLNSYVLQARLGLIAHYDPIVAVETRLDDLHAALARVPEEFSSAGRSEITSRVEASLETLQQKEAHVERFKTENAILRTSARYFPVAAGELAESAGHRPNGAALAAAVQGLASAVMRFQLLGDASWRDLIAVDVASIRASRATLATPQEAPLLDAILAHAQAIYDHKPRLDAAINAIVSLPTGQRVQSLGAAYVTHHEASVARDASWRSALTLEGALLLLLGVAYTLVRLSQDAKEKRA